MRRIIAPFIALAVCLVAPQARAVVAISGPAAHITGYATPVVIAPSGGPVVFANADPLFQHDFVASDAKRPKASAPWCVTYREGECPLFWTPLIGGGEVAQVQGLEGLPAATTYAFYCTIHAGMTGTLIIV